MMSFDFRIQNNYSSKIVETFSRTSVYKRENFYVYRVPFSVIVDASRFVFVNVKNC